MSERLGRGVQIGELQQLYNDVDYLMDRGALPQHTSYGQSSTEWSAPIGDGHTIVVQQGGRYHEPAESFNPRSGAKISVVDSATGTTLGIFEAANPAPLDRDPSRYYEVAIPDYLADLAAAGKAWSVGDLYSRLGVKRGEHILDRVTALTASVPATITRHAMLMHTHRDDSRGTHWTGSVKLHETRTQEPNGAVSPTLRSIQVEADHPSVIQGAEIVGPSERYILDAKFAEQDGIADAASLQLALDRYVDQKRTDDNDSGATVVAETVPMVRHLIDFARGHMDGMAQVYGYDWETRLPVGHESSMAAAVGRAALTVDSAAYTEGVQRTTAKG